MSLAGHRVGIAAIYLKANWRTEFYEDDTKPAAFTRLDGGTVPSLAPDAEAGSIRLPGIEVSAKPRALQTARQLTTKTLHTVASA